MEVGGNRPREAILARCHASKTYPPSSIVTIQKFPLWGSIVVSLLLLAGSLSCQRGDHRAAGPSPTQTELSESQRDHLMLAMRYLFDIDASLRSSDDAIYHLNRWLLNHRSKSDWKVDTLVKRLMPELQAIPEVKRLGRLEFVPSDRVFLEETWWFHSISDQAVTQPLPRQTQQWIAQKSGLSGGDRRALQEACQLFDWTVRHIYLEPLLKYPRILTQGPTVGADGREPEGTFPSMRAEPGPGYRYYPLQNLMMGRGDALNRARVMLLLCRQRSLPAFVLGLDPGGTPRPKPWLCAVLVADQLYLFDPQLGLPIPGKQPGSIATLGELRESPDWAKRLAVGERAYAFAGADLNHVVALIDGSPESLSKRMAVLQEALPTRHQMVTSIVPSRLAEQLMAADSFFRDSGRIRLWNLPFETSIFQRRFKEYMRRSPAQAERDIRTMAILQQLPTLSEARRRHALGLFVDEGRTLGAKTLYLQARLPDSTLAKLPSSPKLQERLGLKREARETPQQFQARIHRHIELHRQAKYLASYWLALAHYDSGMVDVAVNWLQMRTLQVAPDGPFTAGAHYNLARCYERLGKPDQAILHLRQTTWPQQHGDHLRAQMLEQEQAASAP